MKSMEKRVSVNYLPVCQSIKEQAKQPLELAEALLDFKLSKEISGSLKEIASISESIISKKLAPEDPDDLRENAKLLNDMLFSIAETLSQIDVNFDLLDQSIENLSERQQAQLCYHFGILELPAGFGKLTKTINTKLQKVENSCYELANENLRYEGKGGMGFVVYEDEVKKE